MKHIQIRVSDEKFKELRRAALQRDITLQAAGLEAFELWLDSLVPVPSPVPPEVVPKNGSNGKSKWEAVYGREKPSTEDSQDVGDMIGKDS